VKHERRVLVAGPAVENIGFYKQECSIAWIAEDVNITGTIKVIIALWKET
jgi:hypothetical protein